MVCPEFQNSKIRFYHIRALLWTYFAWASLTLWLAYSICESSPFRYPFTRVLYFWALQHSLPLWALWDGTLGLMAWVAVVAAASCVVAGLLKNGWWARLAVIVGMSLWFLWASLLLGISA
jgi:hypothetical protein